MLKRVLSGGARRLAQHRISGGTQVQDRGRQWLAGLLRRRAGSGGGSPPNRPAQGGDPRFFAGGGEGQGELSGTGATTVVVGKRSVRGVFYVLTAKYVFFTHSFALQRFPSSVVSVNVWHGMPVKRVGWMTESGPLLPVAMHAVATSPFWARSFRNRCGHS